MIIIFVSIRSAFLFYYKLTFRDMWRQYPKASVVEIAKHQGRVWRNMTTRERGKYRAMARKDLQRYRNAKRRMGKK